MDELTRAVYVGNPTVWETYSRPDHQIRSFDSPEHLAAHIYDERKPAYGLFAFALHYPETRGEVRIRSIALNAKRCKGATWREAVDGWGLVHLQLTFRTDVTVECRIAVVSERYAEAYSEVRHEVAAPSTWDWKAVQKQTRRLIRVLRKCAGTIK